MTAFDYTISEYPIRETIQQVNQRAWERLAKPGSWWTGEKRIAIAAEVRNAPGCQLCDERKAAISPEAIQGRHDSLGALEESVVEAIHRITRDAGRLSRSWFERVTANSESFSDGHYVEMLGILVTVLGIDSFHRGIGLPPEPLPSPIKGEPSLYRPKAAVADGAYVPMLPFEAAQGDESDLWKGHSGGNVTRAMSLVPDAVRQLNDIEAIYYLSVSEIASPTHNGGKAIDREQIEFLASRVSALNECFY